MLGRRISFETLAKRGLGLVRRGAARGIDIAPAVEEVRRGKQLEVAVTVDSPEAGRPLEIGLVCTETYTVFSPQLRARGSTEAVEDDVAYERWIPADSSQSEQVVTLDVPPDGPFSYDGKYLKFRWRVAARRPRDRGLDAVRSREIRVLP